MMGMMIIIIIIVYSVVYHIYYASLFAAHISPSNPKTRNDFQSGKNLTLHSITKILTNKAKQKQMSLNIQTIIVNFWVTA